VTRRRAFLLAALLPLALSCAPQPPATDGAARWFGSTTLPPPGEFRFDLAAEPETIDPGLASGQPDGRVCRALFEGLTREDPQTLAPMPGQAYRWELTPDGKTYTFHLRPGLVWSDGRSLVAEDFRWAWLRVLEPKTAARNSGLMVPIENAEAFSKGDITDPAQVGITAPDDSTLVVKLRSPTAYFLSLTYYYTFMPTPRHVIERWGDQWTRREHIVNNGAFHLAYWKQNERFEFTRNPRYWDAAHVRLEKIIGYTPDGISTAANIYKAGMIDWNPSGNIPSPFLPYMRAFRDYRQAPYQSLYYYSINTTRKPFDNVWVRRALTYAVDRDAIARDLLKGTRIAWGNFTPMGYPGYQPPPPVTFDPEKARACLARAGYPGGKGFPKLEILFNTSEDHRRIAEAIQAMWRKELHIDVTLTNQEWASYLKATTGLQYDVARRNWIGDYLDPNSFLACFVSGDGNNRTGWSNPRYDQLVHDAGFEPDAAKRLRILRDAEAILLDEAPVIPIYHYTTTELVKPYVRGIYPTPLDVHPLTYVWIDPHWNEGSARAAARPHAGNGGS